MSIEDKIKNAKSISLSEFLTDSGISDKRAKKLIKQGKKEVRKLNKNTKMSRFKLSMDLIRGIFIDLFKGNWDSVHMCWWLLLETLKGKGKQVYKENEYGDN